jgi:mRNA-degrading endonuclease RelE of RelBE toxin-antitoxin system
MFKIEFTSEAIEDLQWFRKLDRAWIIAELEAQLSYEPGVETRNRKQLRPNHLAEWELRARRFRVFFDIDQENHLIRVEAIGYKRRSCLIIRGEEFKL